MQHRFTATLLLLGLAACADQTSENVPGVASDLRSAGMPRYRITKLTGTLGGGVQRVTGINLLGLGAGYSTLPGDSTRHAVLFRGSSIKDLGVLGTGNNSHIQWPGVNELGNAVGISYTGEIDSLDEEWSCESFMPASNQVCRGFFYRNGRMQALPTLGGTHGFATGINNRNQVVGWAQTRRHDPTCNQTTAKLQFRAVLWEPLLNRKTELKPYGNHSTSAATAINERGQVVGISGDCDQAVGRFSARNAVMWENGRVTRLPDLGGTSWHTPMAINEKGDVVGFSNPADPRDVQGEFIARAFLWTKRGGIVNIGNLPGDSTSQALGINLWGQVVGFSSGPAGSRGFLYQNGVLTDINTLREPGVTDSILSVTHINDLGMISGRLREPATGRSVPFVAVPTYGPR